jgi:hypothetical protein
MMRRIIVPALITIVVVGALIVLQPKPTGDMYAEAATIGSGVKDFEELKERFSMLAEEKGGAYAFEVLKRAQLLPNTDFHLLGHAIGDVLYKEKGVDGIALCTQDFRNSCSHSIVIGALNEFGESALPQIRDACHAAPGGSGAYTMCYHGLGHGVFAYFGYDLADTAEFCKKTGTEEYHDREYVECVGGSVMELMGGGGHDRDAWLMARGRYLDPTRPLSPCLDAVVPNEAKEMCLMYITPRLWEIAGINLGMPDPNLFPRAFAYCDAIPKTQQNLRNACFGGFGKEFFPLVAARDVRDGVSYTDDQLTTVATWCDSAEAKDGTRACMADAVSSAFWGGEKDPENAFRLCEVAGGALQDSCFLRLAQDVAQYAQGQQKDRLCTRLPENYRDECQKNMP